MSVFVSACVCLQLFVCVCVVCVCAMPVSDEEACFCQ